MIIDSIENVEKYYALHPLFQKAFDFLKKAENLPVGRYDVDGDNLYVVVSENQLRNYGELEAHRKYIDIQMVLSGEESFWCGFTGQCKNLSKPYNIESDILFFSDNHSMEYKAVKGTVSVFFPEDAHAPLIGDGMVRKIIAKVKI